MKNLKGFKYPTAAKCDKNYHFGPEQPFWTLNVTMGSVDHIQFCLTGIIIPFRLLRIHFDHGKNKSQIFVFWPFPYRPCRKSEVTVGSEDPLRKFLKGYICSRGVKWNTFWPWPIWNSNLPYLHHALINMTYACFHFFAEKCVIYVQIVIHKHKLIFGTYLDHIQVI